MKAKEIREKTDEELAQLIEERSEEIIHFRLQMATGVVDNVRGCRQARREIARIKTIMNERSRAAEQAAAGESN